MHILIVDDKEENRYLLETLLKGNGYDVVSVSNGAKALETLKYGGIELIISDILMPVMDGFEFCRKVRADKSMRHIPFIVYTATYTGPKDEEFAFKIGADRFIVKPCEPDVFMEAVREVTAAKHSNILSTKESPKEEEVLKLYNKRLVRNLEQKMMQLEKEVLARRETEKIQRESEEKYKSILENIEDGYYEVDLSGNFIFFNNSMCRMLGYSNSELMGMNNRKFMDKENTKKVFQTFNRVFTTGMPARELNWTLITKKGAQCHVDTSVSLIINGDGNVTGFRGIARDVTERRTAEKEKALLTEQLQQAQKLESVGRLAGGVAHDFNNLLSIILGYGEMVLQSFDRDHPHREALELIYQAGTKAKAVTRQLLAFSRKQVLETKVCDVNNIVTGFEKLLGRLIGEDIHLNLSLTSKSLMVKADIIQLEQVLMNLAVNARDAMPDGGTLVIETAVVEIDKTYSEIKPGVPTGSYAMIGVTDNGFGMDKETLKRLFEPFFTTKGEEKGTGLGLATSYGIIKQHGGDIWVYSEPNQGTIFKVYLPICDAVATSCEKIFSTPENLQGTETIILVEDNKQVRNLSETILQIQGYTVLTAENGNTALAVLENYEGPLNLLLTDVIMPGMNGRDLFDRISERYPNVKVLFMSGYADDVISHRGMIDDGVNFIQKPFSVKGLAAKVREAIDKK